MQEDKEIQEGNSLIDEFAPEICKYFNRFKGSCRYDLYWDFLMPVVEKIESLQTEFDGYFAVHISSNGCTIAGTRLNTSIENPHYAYFNDITHESKILSTWICIIQFIKFYNNQKGE